MLSLSKRKEYFKALGLGEYNKESILKLQKTYFSREKDCDGVYGNNTDILLRHVYNVKTYTKNFNPKEFKCGCGGKYCTGYPTYMKPATLKNLQTIRDHYKTPITITCGLRCKGYNSSLRGSVSNSLHLKGQAIDMYQQGHTDTLARRKNTINYIKKLVNHHYAYGNGWCSYGYRVSAPNMGNAIHFDCYDKSVKGFVTRAIFNVNKTAVATKVKTTVKAKTANNKAEKLAKWCEDNMWPVGTANSKYAYKTGAPTSKMKSTMNSRGYNTKIAYSDCGFNVNTAIYGAFGKKVKVLAGTKEAMPSVNGFKVVYKGTSIKQSQAKRGYVIRYKKTNGRQHVLISLGNGLIAEGSRGGHFGAIIKSTKYLGKKKLIEVLAPIENSSTVKSDKEKMVDDMMAFAKKYADNQKYHYKKWNSKDDNTKKCPICAKQTASKYLGWNCIGFATAICYHGGGMKHLHCSCSGLGNDGWFTLLLSQAKKSTTSALKTWKHRNGTNWTIVWNKGKKIPSSMLQAGDVCLAYSKDTYKHTFVYAGKGYIYDSTSGKTQISKRKYSSLGVTTKLAFRPTGRKG